MKMTRQVKRQIERAEQKARVAAAHQAARKVQQRALLERQTERENAGVYEGRRSVAAALAPSRSRVTQRKIKKNQPFGRILRVKGEQSLHATKGWRRYVA